MQEHVYHPMLERKFSEFCAPVSSGKFYFAMLMGFNFGERMWIIKTAKR